MKQPIKAIISYAMSGLLSLGMLAQWDVPAAAATYTAEQQAQIDQVQKEHKIPGTTKTEGAFDSSYLSVSGYASAQKYGVGARSKYKEGDQEYAVVKTPKELFEALQQAKGNKVEVIEIAADLDLGWFALTEEEQQCDGIGVYTGNGYTALNTTGCSFSNPDLIKSGISCLEITDTEGLTIFSKEGYSIKHAEIKLQEGCSDIVIRNICFEGMWEWDDWQEGSYGGKGNHKRTGWTTFKLNGADRVWIDHCDFGIAFDGCLDISGTREGKGCEGITVSYCTFGKESMEPLEPGSMLYNTMEYLESIYQESKVNPKVKSFKMYGILRDSGWTKEECIRYGALHSKCHLTGDGDGDYDKNPLTRYTLAFNQYYNLQQRVPMVRQGSVHMYNCYIDYMSRHPLTDRLSEKAKDTDGKTLIYYKKDAKGNKSYYTATDEAKGEQKYEATIGDAISLAGGSTWSLYRAMDARNGASVAADTCVYYGVNGPLIGSEKHKDGLNLQDNHDFGYNHGLIVNSSVTKWDSGKHQPKDAYVGSSWDNDGNNDFLESQNYWADKSTIGNWTWKELTPAGEADKVEYDKYINQKDSALPYSYKTVALDKVKDTVTTYGGAGVLDMTAQDWLKTSYDSSYQVKFKGTADVESLIMDEEATTLATNEKLQLHATTTPKNAKATAITWTSSDEEIATVGPAGLVQPVKTGTVTITATTENGKSASCEVQVIDLPSKVTIVNMPSTIYVGDIYEVEADMEPIVIDESVIVESEDNAVGIIENDNVLKAAGAGQTKLTVTAKLRGKFVWNMIAPATGTKRITVRDCAVPTTGIALDVTSASLSMEATDASVTLNASVLPENSTNKRVRWSSSDETVAVVDNGVVTPVSTGTAVITVTTVNGAKTATCEVTVTKEGGETPPPPVTSDAVMGDVNGDDKVNSDDAVIVLKYFAGLKDDEAVKTMNMETADVNEDGKVNSDDAVEILKKFAGLPSVLDKFDEAEE